MAEYTMLEGLLIWFAREYDELKKQGIDDINMVLWKLSHDILVFDAEYEAVCTFQHTCCSCDEEPPMLHVEEPLKTQVLVREEEVWPVPNYPFRHLRRE